MRHDLHKLQSGLHKIMNDLGDSAVRLVTITMHPAPEKTHLRPSMIPGGDQALGWSRSLWNGRGS